MVLVAGASRPACFEALFKIRDVEFAARHQHAILSVRTGKHLCQILARIQPRLPREFVQLRKRHPAQQFLINGRLTHCVDVGAYDKHGIGGDQRLQRGIDANRSRFFGSASRQGQTQNGGPNRTHQKSLRAKISNAPVSTTAPKTADVQIGM